MVINMLDARFKMCGNVKNFMLELERENLSKNRKGRYVFMFKELKKLKINLNNVTQRGADKYFFYLLSSEYSDETKVTKWKMFKRFCHFFRFKVGLSHRMKVREKVPEILTHEEMENILSNISNLRYRLFFLLLYESGCRVGELLSLTKQNIIFDSNGAIILVSGKTGVRPVRIIFSARHLRQHMENNGCSARLFNFSNEFINRVLKDSAVKAEIKKRVHCHLLRHTRATELSQFLTDREMCIAFGWSRNSKMPAHYSHLSFRDLDRKMLELNGIN